MPSFEFNSLAGRLQESKRFQPLNPIPPKPLHSTEGPAMIYDSIKTKPVTTTVANRAMSGTSTNPVPPKMLKTMEQFQKNMDVPSFLLRGTSDKIVFAAISTSVFLASIFTFVNLYKKANPAK